MPPSRTFRCVTWNVEHGERGLVTLLGVLGRLAPDVAFLQEVDRGTNRSGGVDQAASLARELGLTATFGEAFEYDGGRYGVALLTRGPVRDVTLTRLPHPSPRLSDGRGEPRILLSAEWRSTRLACTHFGLTAEERVDQARALVEALLPYERAVVGGDFNEGSEDAAMRLLQTRYADAFRVAGGIEARTSPLDRPPTRIDFVLASNFSPRPVAAHVGPEGASDHRPVVVDFAED